MYFMECLYDNPNSTYLRSQTKKNIGNMPVTET